GFPLSSLLAVAFSLIVGGRVVVVVVVVVWYGGDQFSSPLPLVQDPYPDLD
ncbi:unnamed protein product, partial [Brassica rapa subsp. trilocularis]